MSTEYFIDTSHNVVYLKSNYLSKFSALKERLEAISQECLGGGINPCGVYRPGECKAYIGIYYDTIPSKNINDLLKREVKHAKGYLILVLFDTINEVYDVCISSSERGKGIGKKLMASVTQFSKKTWLGVDINNGLWDVALNLYTKAGFLSPSIGKTTPNGKKMDIIFVGLTYQHTFTKKDISEAIEKANYYRRGALHKLAEKKALAERCDLMLVMSKTLLRHLREYLDEDREYSGILRVVCYDKKGRGILGYSKVTETAGDPQELVVSHPGDKSYASFHTHPKICYQLRGCYLGWPSAQDMRATLTYYKLGELLNFVVTVEGVYMLMLSRAFQKIVDTYGCVSDMGNAIVSYFEKIEKLRTKGYANEKEKALQLKEYVKMLAEYSIKDMGIECLKSIDQTIKVFKGDFISWERIEKMDEVILKISYIKNDNIKCPLQVDVTEYTIGEERCDRMEAEFY
jgi:GNAT superfamily N-acetyltransferase